MAHKARESDQAESWLYDPDFPAHWTRQSLYSLATWVNGLAFRETQFTPAGKPVIKIAEIKSGISRQTKFTDQDFGDSLRVRSGDLLFSWSGQPETSIDAFWWRGREGWLNQHIFKVAPREGINRIFFFYLLRYLRPNFVGIARNKQTTGLGHVTRRDLEHIRAAFPEASEQSALAGILGALDEKIELNRRMNETLEAMARATFKSWLVDFDPVRAKVEGSQPTGMDVETAALFPASVEESDQGPVPRGWVTSSLAELVDLVVERVDATAAKDAIRYVALDDMPSRSLSMSFRLGSEVNSSITAFKKGDILFGSMRPYFHKVGLAPFDGITRTTTFVLRPRRPEVQCFALMHLFSDEVVAFSTSASVGTTIPYVRWDALGAYDVVCPPREVLLKFQGVASPLLQRIAANDEEARTLTALRDTLLPRLISGDLRVGNTQRRPVSGAA